MHTRSSSFTSNLLFLVFRTLLCAPVNCHVGPLRDCVCCGMFPHLLPVAVCKEGVGMLYHCHSVMVSHAIMELISLSAPGIRGASNEPGVMTHHVFHIQTHPSL